MATQNEILLKAGEINTGTGAGAGNIAAAGGGILKPAQANRFIDFVVDQSVVMQNSRFVRMRTPDQEIDKLSVGTRILSAAAELGDTAGNIPVTFTKVGLTTKKMRLDWAISTESLEDNIEGAGLEDHIAQMMARQTANDLDDILINGGSNGSVTFLTAFDGFIKKTVATNTAGRILSEEGATISRATFDRVLRALPSKFLQRRNELRFFAGSNFVQDTIYSLSNPNSATAATAGAASPGSTAGDMAYLQGSMRGNGGAGSTGLSPYGIPLIEVPLMSENLVANGAGNVNTMGNVGLVASTGAVSTYGTAGANSNVANHGYLELTFPNNRIVGVHRDITVYRQFKPKTDMIEYTQFMRVGCAVENADAYVLATNIKTRTA
jgi:hypothetical protein